MFKWIKLIKFINKHRKADIYAFRILTKSNELLIYTIDKDEMLRIKSNLIK